MPIRARLGVCFIACDLRTPALGGGPPLLAADESLTLARALPTWLGLGLGLGLG